MYSQIDSNKRKTTILIVVFIVFILALGWIFGYIFEIGYWGMVFALGIAAILSLVGYYKGDKVALLSTGAHEIKKEDNPYVYRLVENLCITAGLPLPKIYIIKDAAPNAFACGRDPKHASIALTTGIIEMLKNEELEGVIAHELSHIKNYDSRLMTVVIVLVGAIVLMSDIMIRARFIGGGGRNNRSGQLGIIIFIVGLVFIILSPLIAKLIQFAISRKREFLADASSALLTRYPEGLASALEKISQNKQPLKRASNATAHLFIVSPFAGKKNFLSKAFSTHPPMQERVSALRKMIKH